MNSLERYLGTVRGEKVDFLPRIPILMQFAAEYSGSDYGSFASDYRVMVEANRRCAEDFGVDQMSTMSDPYRETQGFGAEIIYVKDGVPRCPHPPLENTKDLSVLEQPNAMRSERMLNSIRAIERYCEPIGEVYPILGWVEGPAAEAADLRVPAEFLMDLLEDEAFACELMDRCLEVAIHYGKAQLAAGAQTIGIGDAIASQVSSQLYEKFVQPREKVLVKALQDAGAIVRLHICGNITHLLPGIADLGVDILDVDHMVSMKAAREAIGSRVVLTGNLDPSSGVYFSEPGAIRTAFRRIYAEAGNPYMVNAGCEIPAGTPYENLKALCEPIEYSA
jgi:MtaA/CmuA family methyltransferase